MKKLGIIGGAGPLASALFYETIVHESYRLNRPIPEILLLNYPFTRGLTPVEGKKNGAKLREQLQYCLETLEMKSVSVAVLVCNTLHLELANISPTTVRVVHVPTLVLEEVRKQKKKRLLLLATQNTRASSLYSPRHNQNDVTMIHPSSEQQLIVDEVIDRVLEGTLLEKDSRSIENLIQTVSEEIDGVILGCTDLPVLHHHFPIRSEKPLYDSVKIPAKTILRFL